MVLFVEYIRKLIGWCPQQDFESMQFQTCPAHAPSSGVNPIGISSKPPGRMDVPLHGTGGLGRILVIFALYIFFMAISLYDHLNRTFVSYLAVVLTAVALITILFLLDHKKMTFDSEMTRIRTPFLKSSNFRMKDVTNVKTVDNIVYKQMRWAYIGYIAAIVFFGVKGYVGFVQSGVTSCGVERINKYRNEHVDAFYYYIPVLQELPQVPIPKSYQDICWK